MEKRIFSKTGQAVSLLGFGLMRLPVRDPSPQAEVDYEQAEQMFIAMKDRNPEIPVRMVTSPGENHNVSRTGRPESQRVHMQEMVDWFVRDLNKEVERDG